MSDTGAELIAAERQRQITAEGYAVDHDDFHKQEQIAYAAACYALPPRWRTAWSALRRSLWPWEDSAWKPTATEAHRGFAYEHDGDRVRELVKAGALVAAEIDRLQRMSS